MKVLFIHPPQWIPLNPNFSLASLVGQLRKQNHEVIIRDINIEFYNYVLTKEYITKSVDMAFNSFDKLFNDLSKEYSDDKCENEYSEDFKKKLCKYTKIKEFKLGRAKEVIRIPDEIEDSVAVMKSKERFYSPKELIHAINNIDIALELVSLPYFPANFEFHNYNNPFMKLTYDSLKEYCLDRSTNIFYDYYEKILPELVAIKPDFIGVSLNSSYQLIGALTLTMLLKQKVSCPVNIGGNYFSRVVEAVQDHPEMFKLFCDSIIIEEGEKPIVDLTKYYEGKITIEEVPNLIYLKHDRVVVNPKTDPMKLNDMEIQDLEGFPLDQYFTPDIVLSIQASRGCYWKLCSFCDHDFGQRFNIKDVERLIAEIKQLNEKFGISNFEFIDESISPSYLQKMSERILEEGLNITWFNNARLEREFSKELLDLAGQAGLRMALWGFESGSREVMDLINKGIDIDRRLEILKDAIDAGIWNFAFIFFGFPTETWEDAMKTIDTVCANTDVISSYGKSIFTLGKHTRLRDDPEKYCITEIVENRDEFSPSYEFKTSKGMQMNQIMEASRICAEKCNAAYGSPLWMYLRYREIIFLYVSKFGAKEVQSCKII